MKAIKLTNSESVVLVSDEDFERVNQYSWFLKRAKSPAGQGNSAFYYAARSVYAGRKPDGRQITKTVWLHRFLFDEPDVDIHHIDRDKLNCQRYNLETVDPVTHGAMHCNCRAGESCPECQDIPF